MKIISNYIFKQIASFFIYITISFIGLIWLIFSLKFVEYVTNNGLDIFSFLKMTSLLLPSFLPFLTPVTLSISCLLVYHQLSNDNELTILRSSGISKFQILKPAIIVAIIITILNLFLNLYLSPFSKNTFKENQKNLRENIARIAFKEGSFTNISSEIIIYIEEIVDANNFAQIFVYDQRDKENPATYIAKQAELIQNDLSNIVVLKDGNRQLVNKKNSQLNIISFDKYEVDLDLLIKNVDEDRIKEPDEMTLKELWDKKHITSGKYDDNQIKSLQIEGHKRIVNPFYCIIFTLIVLTFLLSDKLVLRSSLKKNAFILFSVFIIELLYLVLPNFLVKKPEFIFAIYIFPLMLMTLLIICNFSIIYRIMAKK